MKIDKIYIVSLDWDYDSVNSVLDVINKVGLPHPCDYEVLGIDGSQLTKHHMDLMGVKTYQDWNLDNGNVNVEDEDYFCNRSAGEYTLHKLDPKNYSMFSRFNVDDR